MDTAAGFTHTHHRLAVVYRRRQVSNISGGTHVYVDVADKICAAQRRWHLRMPNKYIT